MTEREKQKEKLYCIKQIDLWLNTIKYDDFTPLSNEQISKLIEIEKLITPELEQILKLSK